jgi:hypothetical protein
MFISSNQTASCRLGQTSNMKNPLYNIIQQPSVVPPNRGYDNQILPTEAPPIKVTLMSIDDTIISYLRDTIKPQIKIQDIATPVEIIYGTQERWKSIQTDGFLRDPRTDKAQTPLIMIRRTGVSRAPLNNPNNKYLYQTFDTGWNKRNTYDRFAVQNNIRPSKQYRQIVVPDYIKLSYEVILWTEQQEQLNELIEQINVENDEYWGLQGQFKFKVRIDDFSDSSELPPSDIRVIKSSFTMVVDAYLIPEKAILGFKPTSINQNRFTVKKVVAFTEVTSSIVP